MLDNNYFRRWFLIIFALFCIGINVIAFILYDKNQKINGSQQWVGHTYQVITEEYRFFSAIQDMQTSQRTFLITGSDVFLEPHNKALKVIDESIKHLNGLVSDNPEQEQNIKKNTALTKILLKLVQSQIAVKKNQSISVQNIDFSKNKEIVDQIRATHEIIVANEQALLQARRAEELAHEKNYVTTLFLTAALSAIGLLLANVLVAFLTYRRKTAEEDLLRTNKEMEGFTYIASHDLRSPLVNLKGFATEMKYSIEELKPLLDKNREVLPEADYKKSLEIINSDLGDALHYIHSSVEKMDKLTNAILELSRLGRRTLDLQFVDTKRVVRHILDTLHHTVSDRKISVDVLALPDVMADPLSVEQVFSNIIDNAIKYMDPSRPGKIEIGGVKNYRETKFWVKDNGRGISGGDFQKIFEIYRRAGNTENIPGEGMGMAYVRTTLRRMGGQIWCESTPGVGTTFYFTISNSLKRENKK